MWKSHPRDHHIVFHVISCHLFACRGADATSSQSHSVELSYPLLHYIFLYEAFTLSSLARIMARRSTRLSSGSTKLTPRKRMKESSESDFEDGNSSASDFEATEKTMKKRMKIETPTTEDDEEEEGDEEDSDDESKPPKVTIIPLPKAREAGYIPYEDGRLHKNTMLFLTDLKAHNNREWMRCKVPVLAKVDGMS